MNISIYSPLAHQSNGGSNNAYTASEETVYYFDVGGGALAGALSRFSDFFAAPLFSESATAREVAAIDSEHSKNLQVCLYFSPARAYFLSGELG